VSLPKSASNNLQKWFLSPTGRLNFGFITEGKLTNWLRTNKFSGAVAGEKEDFCKGSLSLPIFFTLLLFFLVSLLYFHFLLFIKKYKKLVPTIVVIIVGLLLSCFIMLSINA
jgi:hypothetical protein